MEKLQGAYRQHMAQGFDNLVVGESSSQFTGGETATGIPSRDLKRDVDGKRLISMPLERITVVAQRLIQFNNSLFSIIPGQLASELLRRGQASAFSELFSDVVQKDPGRKSGRVCQDIEFIDRPEESTWQEEVLGRLPALIESIQDKGYSASDIGLIVRDNREGALVLKEILSYTLSCPEEKKAKYNYNIVSGESLLLSNSPAVNFIIAVLVALDNPEDMIARALMLRNFLLAAGVENEGQVPLPGDELISFSQDYFPGGYKEFLEDLKNETLWNITEKVIGFFGLGIYSWNVPYLNAFQVSP